MSVFSEGIEGEPAELFRSRVACVAEQEIAPLAKKAEEGCTFPREVILSLGRAGILRDRWTPLPHGDPGKGVLLAEAIGSIGFAGLAGGISQHAEGATSILARFASNDYLGELLNGCLDGTAIACIAASEPTGGSDLSAVRTSLNPLGPGRWRLRGRKKFVSLSPVADFALVLARLEADSGPAASFAGPPVKPKLALVAVSSKNMAVGPTLARAGVHSLATAPVEFDTEIGAEAIVGAPGAGLMVLTHGLTHERMSIAASVLGSAQLSLGLTATHLRRRVQFGVPLIEHQALRLRLAELTATTEMLRTAVRGTALTAVLRGRHDVRSVAGLKVTAARIGERVISDCMHMFGGPGYLENETPLARLWRDSRIARIAAGTDEVMWEIVAGGLQGNDEAYDAMLAIS